MRPDATFWPELLIDSHGASAAQTDYQRSEVVCPLDIQV